MQFKKFKHTQNEDGSYNILQVPIFNLGKFRGFDFTEAWFKKAKENHEKKKENDYYPSLIIGHNSQDEKTVEKKAAGFFDNLALTGKTIVADLIKIPEEIFNELKKRAYPHRSIEVYPKTAEISALALLGGTEPAHKLPVLELAKQMFEAETDDNLHLHFYIDETIDGDFDKSISELVEIDEERNFIRRAWDVVTSRIWALLHSDKENSEVINKINETLDEAKTVIKKKQNPQKHEEDNVSKIELTQEELDQRIEAAAADKSVEQFKAKYGMTPEEMAAKNQEFSVQLKEKEQAAYKSEVVQFCTELKALTSEDGEVLAPAIVDDMVQPLLENFQAEKFQFAAKETTPIEAVKATFKEIFKKASEGSLLVPMNEQGEVETTPGEMEGVDQEEFNEMNPEEKALMLKASKFQKENPGMSFIDAYAKVTG